MRYSWKPSEGIIKSINVGLGVAVSIVTLVIAFYGLPLYVETLVDKRLKDREVIEKLAKIIRPSMIFNSKESVLADLGASEYIESIKIVKYEDKENTIPTVIEVKPKKHLALAPLLTSIDQYTFIETAERGAGFMWIYKLQHLGSTSPAPPYRFRLEVLQ
jgi:hypothetical protein